MAGATTVGIKKLRRIQFGKEITAGTAVAATTRLHSQGGMLDDQRKLEEMEEEIGIIGGMDRDNFVQLLAQLDLSDMAATPEQAPYFFAMGMGANTTGTSDTPSAGSAKLYTATVPTTSKPTIVPYTVEGGDDFEVERMEYVYCIKIDISGALNGNAKIKATLQGRQTALLAGGFSAATIPAVSELPINKSKIYLDAIGGTYGATQVLSTIVGFKVSFDLKVVPQFTEDGALYYTYAVYTDQKISGSLTFTHDTAVSGNTTGAKVDFRARTPKLLRIALLGDALTTPSTNYTNKGIYIDLPIKYTDAPAITDQGGVDVVAMSFRSRYNATAGNAGKVVIVNEVTALP